MEFETISRNWPMRTPASMHNDLEHPPAPMFYHQDFLQNEKVPRRQIHTVGGDVSDFKNEKDSKQEDIELAAVWPVSSVRVGCYSGYAVAGALFFFGVPFLLPSLNVGENALLSYAAGGVTFFMKNGGAPKVKKN